MKKNEGLKPDFHHQCHCIVSSFPTEKQKKLKNTSKRKTRFEKYEVEILLFTIVTQNNHWSCTSHLLIFFHVLLQFFAFLA